MARRLPGPKEAFALKVTASNIESVCRIGAAKAVAVNVTDIVPLVATTCTVAGVEGSVRTTLAIPASLVMTVRAFSDPPPEVIVNVTGTPGNGARLSSKT